MKRRSFLRSLGALGALIASPSIMAYSKIIDHIIPESEIEKFKDFRERVKSGDISKIYEKNEITLEDWKFIYEQMPTAQDIMISVEKIKENMPVPLFICMFFSVRDIRKKFNLRGNNPLYDEEITKLESIGNGFLINDEHLGKILLSNWHVLHADKAIGNEIHANYVDVKKDIALEIAPCYYGDQNVSSFDLFDKNDQLGSVNGNIFMQPAYDSYEQRKTDLFNPYTTEEIVFRITVGNLVYIPAGKSLENFRKFISDTKSNVGFKFLGKTSLQRWNNSVGMSGSPMLDFQTGKVISTFGIQIKELNGEIKSDEFAPLLVRDSYLDFHHAMDRFKNHAYNRIYAEKGDSSILVKYSQEMLSRLNGLDGKPYYEYKVDSVFGSGMEQAITDLQKNNGIKVTGILDRETFETLKKVATYSSNGNLAYLNKYTLFDQDINSG